ncbi:tRNA pseudouridine(38-40) synthase TruA [Thermospira aquatica]|uniref:tRNA pseudouridine synthase A n=1 Tax=Thermospira aquatica TaxID=2828656 RepID=A0AAX3BCG3_9SPIR|nr:tRNA pseudouridine(38-40) synthase TruA [Thermospira aquatica]URA09967.1 tRNA pseudouridine(38-40) synthase TruA [Thermospira aquatica]
MNVRLDISYDGSLFSGWQRQKKQPSVQETVEQALGKILGENVRVWGCGRTDAGAHAFCYTLHFHCDNMQFPVEVLPRLLDSKLPESVKVLRAMEVEEDFHARFSAFAREYVYIVWRGSFLYPFLCSYVYWDRDPLDYEMVKKVCKLIEGEHDFRFLCYGYGKEASKINFTRKIFYFRAVEKGQWLFFFIKGNGFLRGMIRTLVGITLQAAKGQLSLSEIEKALGAERDLSSFLKKAVPASGLYFKRAYYLVSHEFQNDIKHGSGEED